MVKEVVRYLLVKSSTATLCQETMDQAFTFIKNSNLGRGDDTNKELRVGTYSKGSMVGGGILQLHQIYYYTLVLDFRVFRHISSKLCMVSILTSHH